VNHYGSDWSVIEPQAYPVCTVYPLFDFTCSTAWIGLVETLKIAFVSTVFGMMLSLPISLLAARNLNYWWVSYIFRFILASFRSLPEHYLGNIFCYSCWFWSFVRSFSYDCLHCRVLGQTSV